VRARRVFRTAGPGAHEHLRRPHHVSDPIRRAEPHGKHQCDGEPDGVDQRTGDRFSYGDRGAVVRSRHPGTDAGAHLYGVPGAGGPLTVYYVAVGDNGRSGPQIGCGDSLIATKTAPVRFTDQVGPSIRALLANKSRDLGESGFVNVLYQSNLTYLGGELEGSTITIWLSGQFMLGDVCDVPRAKAQLEYTAMAASDATSAQVFVNGRPIDDVLSLK
jgi:hypothetical protein